VLTTQVTEIGVQLTFRLISCIFNHSPLLFRIVPSLKPCSVSANRGGLVLLILDSPPSSPNRKAAFSRLGPETGLLPDLRNGETDFGGDDLTLDTEETSGSSIHENEEFAIVDRVGTGAFGRSGIAASGSDLFCSETIDSRGVSAVVFAAGEGTFETD